MSKLKAFILTVFEPRTDINDLLVVIDGVPHIENWMAIAPNTLFLVSALNAHDIQRLIMDDLEGYLYLITQYHAGEANGMLTDDMWEFLNNPKVPIARVPAKPKPPKLTRNVQRRK